MASIQQYTTKDGQKLWLFKLYLGIDPGTGKRKGTTKRGFRTEKEANEAAADLEYKLRNNEVTYSKTMLFKDLADEWLEYYSTMNKKASSVRVRRHCINNLNKYFGYLQTRAITKKKYQDMLEDLHTQEYKYNSINSIHSTGKMIFQYAKNHGIALEDVSLGTIIPRSSLTVEEIENKMREADLSGEFYEKAELATFLNAAKKFGEWQDFTIFTLLVYSGMRPGELCALNKDKDLDFEKNQITITKTIYQDGPISTIMVTPPKTEESIRVIDMDPAIMTLLKQHIEWHQSYHIKAPHQTYNEQGFLFARTNSKTYRGYPFAVGDIDNKMERILKKVPDLKSLTPHKLRHTHTSLLAESEGANIEAIMSRLGHKDDRTTRLIYMHVTNHRKERLSKNFSEVMKDFLTIS
ncbi:tyrosine-type recombinase/integrase [Listeria riparia]|uniref:Integrase n=1 Tax=Listeria riparia FSL S10-1204 TaxID=1265816 RepID=W7D8H8_9LIST|nr:tyrosine-type recombinase/integrase [Listeria riparia]EUJ45290.1 integrase [Listeria riparia FSL S10-1204]